MRRRSFLGLGLAAIAATKTFGRADAAPVGSTAASVPQSGGGAVFVPGYWPGRVFHQGRKATEDRQFSRAVPANYTGPLRLLTRIDGNGGVLQAVFPVLGHGVEISPRGGVGCFAGMEEAKHVAFDPATLDLIAVGEPFAKGWRGGGHCLFVKGGDAVLIAERAPRTAYRGRPDDFFGRVTVRDPKTLAVIGSYSSHGIDPHDVRLLEDGRHIVVANYGSVLRPGEKALGAPRDVRDACVTIVDIADGKLVDKIATGSRNMEVRHLCGLRRDRIFAIQARLGTREDEAEYHQRDAAAYEIDRTAEDGQFYMAAPTLRVAADAHGVEALGSEADRALMRHGLSIQYDPRFDEVIATYPTTHRVIVFDGATGAIKQLIDTARLGLRYPCGVALMSDDRHYVVTGYWENMYVYERGTHQLNRERCVYETLFGHSHITAT